MPRHPRQTISKSKKKEKEKEKEKGEGKEAPQLWSNETKALTSAKSSAINDIILKGQRADAPSSTSSYKTHSTVTSKGHKTTLSRPTSSPQSFPAEANKGPGPVSKPADDTDEELDVVGVSSSPMVTDGSTYEHSSTPPSESMSEPDGTDSSDAYEPIIKRGEKCNAEDVLAKVEKAARKAARKAVTAEKAAKKAAREAFVAKKVAIKAARKAAAAVKSIDIDTREPGMAVPQQSIPLFLPGSDDNNILALRREVSEPNSYAPYMKDPDVPRLNPFPKGAAFNPKG